MFQPEERNNMGQQGVLTKSHFGDQWSGLSASDKSPRDELKSFLRSAWDDDFDA